MNNGRVQGNRPGQGTKWQQIDSIRIGSESGYSNILYLPSGFYHQPGSLKMISGKRSVTITHHGPNYHPQPFGKLDTAVTYTQPSARYTLQTYIQEPSNPTYIPSLLQTLLCRHSHPYGTLHAPSYKKGDDHPKVNSLTFVTTEKFKP